ncbi:MAG: DUF883 C-terminal domain-containing protein [Acidobacteriota bacterium]
MVERNKLISRSNSETREDDRSADEIRRDIANRRESLTGTVERLGDHIQQRLDWRQYVADYPFVAIGVAAGVGFLFSGMFKRTPTPGERIMDAVAESLEDMRDRLYSTFDDLPLKKNGVGKTVKAAATAIITKQIADYLKDKLTAKIESSNNRIKQADISTPKEERARTAVNSEMGT